jgi:uncharacterized protein YbjT (DUF2867 family)
MILITGATGNIGSELVKLLDGQNIRTMIRSEGTGDFNDPASVEKALQGIERAFLLTNSSEQAEQQQLSFVALAKKAGVKHIVKLSQWSADVNSPVRFLRYHAVVENKIRESGMTYTFLRPNLFMQGLLDFVHEGKFFAPIGDAKISMVDIRDIAAVAAAALTETGHENKIYNLTGPAAITHQQIAEELSTALNKKITFINVTPPDMRAALSQIHFPEWQADGLIEDYAHYAKNEAASVETGVLEATGKTPRSFAEFARDYAPAFK